MLLNDKVVIRMQWPQFAELQINGMTVTSSQIGNVLVFLLF